MVNVECFIVFCSSRLGRVLVISIRRFAKAYLLFCESLSADLRKPICCFPKVYPSICEKRCKVISFSPYNDAVATHFNFAPDRTRCLLAFYNNCVITQSLQRLQSITSTLLHHRSPLPIPIPFVPSTYLFYLSYLPSLHLPSLSQRHQKQSISLPSTRGRGRATHWVARGEGLSTAIMSKHFTPLHKGRGRAARSVARGRGFLFF